jgi:hypothetical protein
MASAGTTHIFCVPFPGGGHAVNMYNTATTLATASVKVHVLVLSQFQGNQWLKATGQPANQHMDTTVLANGKWEDWRGHTAPELFGMVSSDDFRDAVEEAIASYQSKFAGERCTAIVHNPMMMKVAALAWKLGMKNYLLIPVPQYTPRLGACAQPGPDVDLDQTFEFKGIAGSDKPMFFQPADAVDMFSPQMASAVMPTWEKSSGVIYCNTNTGIEGEQWKQPHLPNIRKEINSYMIGPILPAWFENALEQPEAARKRRDEAAADEEVLRFMDQQADKSTVYIATGTHVELDFEQAQTLVEQLRKYGVKWVLLFIHDTEKMKEMLGGDDLKDGVVTTWAPQLEVLSHPALKTVISHGGFGTMIEGIHTGQTFMTLPTASDQFMDSKVMEHMGFGLGTLAENTRRSVMALPKITPTWTDETRKRIEESFEKVFGPGGDEVLTKAREASLNLRKRLRASKETESMAQLETLRKDMATGLPN